MLLRPYCVAAVLEGNAITTTGSCNGVLAQHSVRLPWGEAQHLTLGGEKIRGKDAIGYDGQSTRVVQNDSVANIRANREEIPQIISRKPHTLLLEGLMVTVPLSTFLRGSEAMRGLQHAGSYGNGYWTVEPTLEPDEVLNGELCRKVRILLLVEGATRAEAGNFILWLSTVRNLIPVRLEAHSPLHAANGPHMVGEIQEFLEIDRGIFFPKSATLLRYLNGTDKMKSKDEWKIEKAVLDPAYDDAFFRIDIPDGASVFEVVNGKIVKSYTQGRAEAPADRRTLWIIIAINVLIAACLLTFWIRRRRRRAIALTTPVSRKKLTKNVGLA